MKRREALKNLGLATGFFVATPTVISLLQSCTAEPEAWKPVFLTTEQGVVLTRLTNIILPDTDDLPSVTDLNVPQFIDRYVNDVFAIEDQGHFKTAFDKTIAVVKPTAETDVRSISDEDYRALLDKHMLLKGEIDEERESHIKFKGLTVSEFLNQIKNMTIKAYKTTQEIGENVMVYDPVPAQYFCGDLQELTGGKDYSLS